MSAYYNEHDACAAAWLRELIKDGLIADGMVDERDIQQVEPADLRGFTQCHFFAGIGVWSYALRAAGWPDDSPVWTGSCPCQGFSASGKRGGFSDQRHLWPAWFRLIRELAPGVVFGEQVSSKDGLAWFDVVSSDMEDAGYAIGALDICAAGVGAPHIRQRLYFVANSEHVGLNGSPRVAAVTDCDESGIGLPERDSAAGELADAERGRREQCHARERSVSIPDKDIAIDQLGDTKGRGLRVCGGAPRYTGRAALTGEASSGRLADAQLSQSTRCGFDGGSRVCLAETEGIETPSLTNGFWRDAEWLPCRDGKMRPVKPGIFPLAHGATNRVGKLRGAGNALVAPCAEEFIRAAMEVL